MATLTKRQHQIREYIRQYSEENGYAPTLEDIAEFLQLSSKATVHKHLRNLEDKGVIRREEYRSRAIELTDMQPLARAVELPLMGVVAAGMPIQAVRDNETISVPEDMIGRSNTYVLRVRGDSMIDEHIRDGDYVIVEETDQARNGDTVIALIDHEDVTMKVYYREGRTIRLQPANESLAPIYVDEEHISIQGKVIGVMRKYAR